MKTGEFWCTAAGNRAAATEKKNILIKTLKNGSILSKLSLQYFVYKTYIRHF
jgi:hypothetical protein